LRLDIKSKKEKIVGKPHALERQIFLFPPPAKSGDAR
jgi:hypothetical protein